MTLELYTQIMKECHVDDPKYITPEHIEETYHSFGLTEYKNDAYLCLCAPPFDGTTHVMLLWVHPMVRNKGLATKLLSSLPTPHEMVVDYRSESMHKLLTKLGYKSRTWYKIDENIHQLHGGDLLYYKENS